MRLLKAEGLQRKILSADTSLLQASLAQKGVEKGGLYRSHQDNPPQMKQALETYWLSHRPLTPAGQPDWQKTEKRHGRLETRKAWLVPCTSEMQAYLRSKFAWSSVQYCGWIERQRKNVSSGKEQRQVSTWIAGAAFAWELSASLPTALLRGHWGIENGVFYVRDATMDEDRWSGRKIGYHLSAIRNAALSLLCRLAAPYIPDARLRLAARPDLGLPLIYQIIEKSRG